jgi:hypothetical protein
MVQCAFSGPEDPKILAPANNTYGMGFDTGGAYAYNHPAF